MLGVIQATASLFNVGLPPVCPGCLGMVEECIEAGQARAGRKENCEQN
jgi:hypothetical protein